jgi:hypothetical protein
MEKRFQIVAIMNAGMIGMNIIMMTKRRRVMADTKLCPFCGSDDCVKSSEDGFPLIPNCLFEAKSYTKVVEKYNVRPLEDALQAKLDEINAWINAYPLEAFPEPDLKKAHELLKAGGVSLGAVSASNMRHVLKGIKKIIALDPDNAKL